MHVLRQDACARTPKIGETTTRTGASRSTASRRRRRCPSVLHPLEPVPSSSAAAAGAFPPPTPSPANPPQCILTFLNYVGRFCPRPALNPTPLGIFCFRLSFNSEV